MTNIIDTIVKSAKNTLENRGIVKMRYLLTGEEAEDFNCSMPPNGITEDDFCLTWLYEPSGEVYITCYLKSTLESVYE